MIRKEIWLQLRLDGNQISLIHTKTYKFQKANTQFTTYIQI